MTVDEINPFIRYAKIHTDHAPKTESSLSYDCRLFYISKGDGFLIADGERYTVCAHTVLCIFPAISYRFLFKSPHSVNICVLNFDFTAEYREQSRRLGTATERTFDEKKVLLQHAPSDFPRVLVRTNAQYLSDDIHACVELFADDGPYARAAASGRLKLTLVKLLAQRTADDTDTRLCSAVQAFIRAHAADSTLSNASIAESFGYHPYYLSQLLKKQTGVAMHEYLLSHRLRMARELLATSAQRVTDIAEACGFASYTYFIKLFRERIGETPTAYRARRKTEDF
ncbi:MAG: helix-turn-helix transcriptional regulator [Clostridiales bacterium]|nr:helix-turn-helix transcriptional regulator [Clostridiales bacterium]